jgi:glycine betaine/choline ABC-type transport system substrate-binding protein
MRRLTLALVALLIAGCAGQASPPSIAVGAGADPESALLAHVYAAALRFHGSPAHVETSTDPIGDLDTGDVTVAPGLTGRLLQRFDPGATARAGEQVYRSMIAALPEGVAAADYAESAMDEPAAAVSETTAKEWGGRDVTTLTSHCDELTAGTVGTVVGADAPTVVGTCRLPKVREYPFPTTLFGALRSGEVDVAWTSTAAPKASDGVVVLSDRTALIRAENVVPLYARNALTEAQVRALSEVAGELDTATLSDMLRQVADGKDPGAVAAGWIDAHPLGGRG